VSASELDVYVGPGILNLIAKMNQAIERKQCPDDGGQNYQRENRDQEGDSRSRCV
jgi:hypothetical protein